MGTLRGWEAYEKQAVAGYCFLASDIVGGTHMPKLNAFPYAVQVKSDSFITNLEAFGCCPPVWPTSGSRHPGPVASQSGVHHKWKDPSA